MGSGSHVRVYQPWTVNEYGYTTSVVAKLFQVEAATSLAYRQLIEADVMDVREMRQLVFLSYSKCFCMSDAKSGYLFKFEYWSRL